MNHYYCSTLKQRGASLIEIMITISVLAILTTIATPSFSALMTQSSLKSTRQALIQDLRLVRSHARTRGQSAYLCGLNAQGQCARLANWHHGWMGFIDNNNNRHFDENDAVLLQYQPDESQNISIYLHTRWLNVKFDAHGIVRSSGHFRVCDPNTTGLQEMPVIRMNAMGRLSMESDKKSCA